MTQSVSDDVDDVAVELRLLAALAAPAVQAPPNLAELVLHGHRRATTRRRLIRRASLGLTGLVVAGAVAASAQTGHRGYLAVTQPSAAMRPTVSIGQTVVLKKRLTPARGDVVLAHLRVGGESFDALKRVIGLPGDTVGCPAAPSGRCDAVVVNGRALDETYLAPGGTDAFATATVPAGEVFLLGDDRAVSADSRQFGPVPLRELTGVAVRIEDADGSAHPVPGAPSHSGPPSDGIQDVPGPVGSAMASPPSQRARRS